jgi:two-component system CheB/CheR fusion protein
MKKIRAAEEKSTVEKTTLKDGTDLFPIVGIGASAGGLDALEQFFQNMPENSGMAFVVIQHLDPNHSGIMPELLQRITSMKVFQAADHLKVKPNYVYVIPPNKSLAILKGSLHLFDPVESRGLRLPIDIFFRSLADDCLERSIGIILSGMGSDGSLGLHAIKEKNGLVLVQEPSSAKFDSMPRSAIDSVVVDIVAPVNELPGKLISFLKLNPGSNKKIKIESKERSNIDKIIILIRDQTGHDFSMYKKTTLFRRIERRKGVHEIENIANYVRFLQENPNEVEILFKELLIGVTSFFRDTAVWEMLRERVLPGMIKQLPNDYQMRAWVTGCSSGEEAYSLAIVFKEVMEDFGKHKNISLQIFATDIDNDAVEKARKGFFPKNIASDISPERINQFFNPDGEGYRIKTSIREMVVFASQNVVRDPPFTKLDILTCRNMLIYMEPVLQKKLMTLFSYSLNPAGILLIGTSETLDLQNEAFKVVDPKLKIFKRSTTNLVREFVDFPSSFDHPKISADETALPPKNIDNVQSVVDQILIQRFAPASVLVNNRGDIIYITGRTGKYLEPVAGKANWNIHAMAREGLRQELLTAFRKISNNFDPIILHNLKVGTDGGTQYVTVTVQRIDNPESIRGMIMVVFKDIETPLSKSSASAKGTGHVSAAIQKELELELKRANEEIQSIREQMQTSQEELKSANEELQSTNEELQSANEELTTSKEEMQSLNEELQTVNIELQSKVSDFVKANDDMKNLLNSTEVASLFLDKDLNVRRFTDAVTTIFKLRTSDIGRPFTDIVNSLIYSEIATRAQQVIKTLITVDEAVKTNDGKWYNVRILPYRTIEDRIDGLVITFNDITIMKKLEMELREARDALGKRK